MGKAASSWRPLPKPRLQPWSPCAHLGCKSSPIHLASASTDCGSSALNLFLHTIEIGKRSTLSSQMLQQSESTAADPAGRGLQLLECSGTAPGPGGTVPSLKIVALIPCSCGQASSLDCPHEPVMFVHSNRMAPQLFNVQYVHRLPTRQVLPPPHRCLHWAVPQHRKHFLLKSLRERPWKPRKLKGYFDSPSDNDKRQV